jgi:hypothetical protein
LFSALRLGRFVAATAGERAAVVIAASLVALLSRGVASWEKDVDELLHGSPCLTAVQVVGSDVLKALGQNTEGLVKFCEARARASGFVPAQRSRLLGAF